MFPRSSLGDWTSEDSIGPTGHHALQVTLGCQTGTAKFKRIWKFLAAASSGEAGAGGAFEDLFQDSLLVGAYRVAI